MTRLVLLMVAGEEPRLKADYDNDYYNARQQEKRANMSVAELRAELEKTRSDLLEFIESLEAEDLGKVGEHPIIGKTNVLGVLKQLQTHERDHIVEMGASVDELVQASV